MKILYALLTMLLLDIALISAQMSGVTIIKSIDSMLWVCLAFDAMFCAIIALFKLF